MKKILISIVMMSACTLWGETIKRVTYFPIPYVAYSRAEAEKLDLCLDGEDCEVRLGSSACTTAGTCPVPLTVSSMTVSSTLTLQGNNTQYIESDTITLGNVEGAGGGNLKFENLRLGNAVTVGSLGTTSMNISSLNLFGYDFPRCDAAGNKIQWAQVSTTNAEVEEEPAHYLVCGEGTTSTPESCTGGGPASKTRSEACGTGYTGYRNYTWQGYPTCNWIETSNTCTKNQTCTWVKDSMFTEDFSSDMPSDEVVSAVESSGRYVGEEACSGGLCPSTCSSESSYRCPRDPTDCSFEDATVDQYGMLFAKRKMQRWKCSCN